MPTAIVMLKIRSPEGDRHCGEVVGNPEYHPDVYSRFPGRFDLLVIIKCESIDLIESVITDELLKTEGILESGDDVRVSQLRQTRRRACVDVD